jgi:alpha-beta hydrolase superfamily lysophospholipase
MTAIVTPLATSRTWRPAAGVTERGHVVLFTGRGEHPGVYERLGHRFAYDGYRLSAIGDGDGGDELRAALADGLHPLVLAGSDTGALRALATTGVPAAGYLLVGVPVSGTRPLIDWPDELDARTACPAHRGRLESDSTFGRGELFAEVPRHLADVASSVQVTVPALVVHGDADRIAPLAGARTLAARLPHADLVVVRGGRHDVLNDINHRTVAAHVVAWLERLRADASAAPIVAYEEGS